ncbi:MAG: hypothetical protein M3Q58_12505 [Bacteroidota bacterium]|nr:hypothetical protein [Bacteroidota bacterium]
MTGSDNLFLLIKSLSKAEKRNFKLLVSRVGDTESNYIKLFDAIDRQKDYDEKNIKKIFKNETFIKQLTFTKNYLYNLILESLRNISKEESVEFKLRTMLKNAEILFNKTLYNQSGLILERAKKLALENEKHLFVLQVLGFQSKLMLRESDLKTMESEMNQIYLDEMECLKKQENLSEISFRSLLMLYHTRKVNVVRSKEELEPFDQIISHPVFEKEENCLSSHARFHFINTYSLYYRIKNEPEKLYTWRKRLLDYMESNAKLCETESEQYFVALNNLIYACINIGNYEEALTMLDRMELIKTHNEDQKVLVLTSRRNLRFAALFYLGEFEKAADELENDPIEELNEKMYNNQKQPFNYYNALIYFALADYKKALFWINKVMEDKEKDFRQDLHNFARILNLVIHYELGNTLQVEYYVKQTYRYMYSRSRLYKAEWLVMNFLRDASKINHNYDLVPLFDKLKKDIIELTKDPYEKKLFDYIDFVSWLQSKTEGRTFAEVRRENIKLGQKT